MSGPSGERMEADGVAEPGAGLPMHVHFLQKEAARVIRGRLGHHVLGGEPEDRVTVGRCGESLGITLCHRHCAGRGDGLRPAEPVANRQY